MRAGAGNQSTITIAKQIFNTKGAFCTPRSVIRSITTKVKPTATEVIAEMKNLHEKKLGIFKSKSDKERVFYKLLPETSNEDLITPYINFDHYKKIFEDGIDSRSITPSQCTRLLADSPDKEILTDKYGY